MKFLKRNFGIEIEACGGSPYHTKQLFAKHKIARKWNYHEDGSLYGSNDNGLTLKSNFETTEISSKILPPAINSFNVISKAAEILQANDYYTNKTCGTHVHIDAKNETIPSILCVVYLYGLLEQDLFDRIVPSHRKKNNNDSACSVKSNIIKSEIITTLKNKQNLKTEDLWNLCGTRNSKVNLQALEKHGTIEFRQFNGSLSSVDLVNWAKLLHFFVDYCGWISNINNFKTELKLIKDLDKELIKKMNGNSKLQIPEEVLNKLTRKKLISLLENLSLIDFRLETDSLFGTIEKTEIYLKPKTSKFFEVVGFGNYVSEESIVNHFISSLRKELPSVHGWAIERAESLFPT